MDEVNGTEPKLRSSLHQNTLLVPSSSPSSRLRAFLPTMAHPEQLVPSTSARRDRSSHDASSSAADPFLSQPLPIPLTARDRQEGYDVALLRAQPRGLSHTGRRTSGEGREAGERAGGGAVVAGSTAAAGVVAGSGLGEGGTGGKEHGYMGPGAGGKEGGRSGNDSSAALADETQREGGTTANGGGRPWFLRPLPLVIIFLLFLGLALGLGLGIGLGKKDSEEDKKAAAASSSSSAALASGRATSAVTSGGVSIQTASRGTVIPSSLAFSYTPSQYVPPFPSISLFPSNSSPAPTPSASPSQGQGAAPAAAAATANSVPRNATQVQPPTTIASTGNLPIPDSAETTIGSLTLRSVTPGNRRRRRRG
jgi:hypothetical protein